MEYLHLGAENLGFKITLQQLLGSVGRFLRHEFKQLLVCLSSSLQWPQLSWNMSLFKKIYST